ncbi:hypothetical protein, partial [Vibrio vulnificus]|uniref:hypothetical protein n=1 Tax=Vibrio vulnificus TaxID=672 RepID=UPI001F5085CD
SPSNFRIQGQLTMNFSDKHNAALRGECRINQLYADHFHHQNSLQTKNATRHESLLNALLCNKPKVYI